MSILETCSHQHSVRQTALKPWMHYELWPRTCPHCILLILSFLGAYISNSITVIHWLQIQHFKQLAYFFSDTFLPKSLWIWSICLMYSSVNYFSLCFPLSICLVLTCKENTVGCCLKKDQAHDWLYFSSCLQLPASETEEADADKNEELWPPFE